MIYYVTIDLYERKAFTASEVREYSKALRATFSFLEGYSWQITTSEAGYGLHELLKDQKSVLSGNAWV
ncbi:hypothetical protein HN51_007163 [Arachis hypogaea]